MFMKISLLLPYPQPSERSEQALYGGEGSKTLRKWKFEKYKTVFEEL